MRGRNRIYGLASVVILALLASKTWSQEEKAAAPPDEEQAAMMAMFKELGEPGEFHKNLEPLVGRWDYSIRWRMSPEQPWEESKGTAEYSWIFDGRYLVQKAKGEMADGEAFRGRGILGYDKLKKQYTSVWIDSMTTSTMVTVGQCDPSGKIITMKGETVDPMTHKTMTERSVTRIINNDKHVYEMHRPGPDGKEFMSLEVTYTRK